MNIYHTNQPFTYYIYHKPTGLKYYGARYKKACHPGELWTTYFTSSKRVKALIEQYGKDSFHFEVRKTFSTNEECLAWESKVLVRLHAVKSSIWLNDNVRGQHFAMHGKRPKETMDRVANTQKQRYGDYGFRQQKVIDKQKATWKEKYGVDTFKQVGLAAFKQQTGYDNIRHVPGTCPHCGKKGQWVSMQRWHFDRCRARTDVVFGPIICPHCAKEGNSWSAMQRWHFDRCRLKATQKCISEDESAGHHNEGTI